MVRVDIERPHIRGLSMERRRGLLSAFRGTKLLVGRYFSLVNAMFAFSPEQCLNIVRDGNITHLYDPLAMMRGYNAAGMFVENGFMNGARRVFDRHGNYIKLNPTTNWRAVQILQRNQYRYLKNLEHRQQDVIGDILYQGGVKGWSTKDIAKEIYVANHRITRHRANVISRTEIIHAHVSGTRETMAENDIERYQWWATKDKRTCHICKAFHGRTFKTMAPVYGEGINAKTEMEARSKIMNLEDRYSFMPVKNSHPQCRCAILADI
jgi:SPP1 gp7 family putative phage head morphogenesis protein